MLHVPADDPVDLPSTPQLLAAEASALQPALDGLCAEAGRRLAQLAQPPTDGPQLLGQLNALGRLLDAAGAAAALLRSVHPQAQARQLGEATEQQVEQLACQLAMSGPLFAALSRLDPATLPADAQRLRTLWLRDARRAGVHLPDAQAQQVAELKAQLVRLGQAFEANIRGDVRRVKLRPAQLDGLPEDYLAAHPPGDDGQVTVSTHTPDLAPLMAYAHDDEARRLLLVASRQRGAPANAPVLAELLACRARLAQLLGHDSWAAFATADKMSGSPAAVHDFLQQVASLAQGPAEAELRALGEQLPAGQQVQSWQRAYLQERTCQQRFGYDAQAARAYFILPRVQQGLFDLCAGLFGLSFERRQVPVWHPSVQAWTVHDGDGLVGHFYLDLHPRPDKYQHAAVFPLRAGIAQACPPEAALVCNFPPGPTACVEHHDVTTFFHEFGHLLHHLFAGRQRWARLSGIACEWDFVEAPSQLMEEWAYDLRTLQSFAHDPDGRPLPADQVAALNRARRFGQGILARTQVFYAMLSLQLHGPAPAPDAAALCAQLHQRYSPLPAVEGTFFHLGFDHLSGYSALYYTYLWSQVLAQDFFSLFARQGLHDRQLAERYRRCILDPGGASDAASMAAAFLGRPPSQAAFAAWLSDPG